MKRREKTIEKRKESFLFALVLILSLIITPVTQAMEDQAIGVDESLVVNEENVINYKELSRDMIQGLDEADLNRLKDKIVSDYINRNPDAVLEIPFTYDQIQKATKKKETNIEELVSKNLILLEKQSKIESLNVGTNETFNRADAVFTSANSGFSLTSLNKLSLTLDIACFLTISF